MRIALGIEYNGANYCGWQRQTHCVSVQATVEKALSQIADHPLQIICAGRTDAGVHALGQVIHFETAVERDTRAWVFGANANLPADISVLWAKPVADTFHARYSALRRGYRYVILNRSVRPGLLQQRVAWDYRSLDVSRMQQAGAFLVGEHDFSSYRAQTCQAKNPVRTVSRLEVQRQHDVVIIDIEANAFLHHMVRNIAGVLMTIGAGEQPPLWAKQVLERRDRTQGGITAAPQGLYFITAYYPVEFDLPAVGILKLL
ncbi:MAG: tRNA pseudouridine(38-40) synthase TruA [Gammaproteobacteria bacterium]|nr:tRNA pseudouridine(38-40) synthase TruA [Gammaproteobacteria bacterium]